MKIRPIGLHIRLTSVGRILTAASMLLASHLMAQVPRAGAADKPDSAEVKADIERAKKIAGKQWAVEARFFCESPRGTDVNDPLIEPTRIFDNLSVLGNQSTVVYLINTSAGYIMIDSLYANQVQPQLLPGLEKLGVDPASIKVLIISHGHADHFGGARYFQEKYGTRVFVSAVDWNLMENPPPPRPGKAPKLDVPPKRDLVIVEGQPIALGDEEVMPVFIPGHTPGAMGFTFRVRDHGEAHVAGMFGGSFLETGGISDEGMQLFKTSIAHFEQETKKAKVDVEVQNHPLMDSFTERLALVRKRQPNAPNPFVVGQANYQNFLGVMSECLQANIDRRKE
jgi:metallo-beta-lactamase class B